MNNQEREQLTHFLQQLTQAQAAQKDGEADALIREACLRQPDAAYLLVQRAMLLDHAVQDAQAQVSRLQDELSQARAGNNGGGFLDANAWGNSAVTRTAPTAQAPLYPAAPAPAATAPAPSAWGSGMLGNIATTAAGVVAGGFLFQGIEHLLGNHGANSGLTNGLSSNPPVEHHDAPAVNSLADDLATNTGVFDTSSVDSFIAGETGGSDDIV
jgi:hypothetical protein